MGETRKFHLSIETALYLAAFLLALGFRLMRLGDLPMGDREASLALQALELSRHGQVAGSGAPGYLSLTAILFFLLGESSWLARFFPMLAGSLLVLVPALFKNQLGKAAAVAFSFLLAVDPVLVASSRQVDARMLSVLALMAGLGFWLRRDALKTGIALGFAALCGVPFWLEAAGLLLAWLIVRAFRFKDFGNPESNVGAYDDVQPVVKSRVDVKTLALWGVGTLLAVGSLFLIKPALLGGAAEGLAEFARGFIGSPAGIPLGLFLIAGLVSAPLGWLLAAAETVESLRKHEQTGFFLAIWWGTAVILALIYPARQAMDWVMPAIPSLALASRFLVRILQIRGEKTAFYAYAILSIVLMGSIWLNGVGVISAWNEAEQNARLATLLASVFLLLAATFLVIWGWGLSLTGRGFRLGVAGILLLAVCSNAWRAAGLGTLPENELLRLDPYVKDGLLLSATLSDLSLWKTGGAKALDIGVMGLDNPALRWLLRQHHSVTYAEGYSTHPPSLLVTPKRSELGLSAPYSGQALTWTSVPAWEQFSTSQWMKWLAFREAPLIKQTIQVWARSDVFPGGLPLDLGK